MSSNPRSADTVTVRTPNGTSTSSAIRPSTDARTTARYSTGVAGDHSRGRSISISSTERVDPPGSIRPAPAADATGLPSGPRRVTRTVTSRAVESSLRTVSSAWTVAESAEAAVVARKTPPGSR